MSKLWLVSSVCAGLLLSGCGQPLKPVQPASTPTAPSQPVMAAAKPAETPTAPKEDKKPEEPKKEEVKPAPAAGGATQEMQWGRQTKFTMTVPSNWKQEEVSGMRQLQVKVPKTGADAEDGEMVGFNMPGGGGVEANLGRWVSQMGGGDAMKNRKKVKTASGIEATVAELDGTYSAMSPRDGSPMPAKAGYKMLGVFIPTDSGEVYMKLTGPKETIEAQKAAFDKMVESFK